MGLNKIVDFSTAKLLKEKGFDNESSYYYNEQGEAVFDGCFPSLQSNKPEVYFDIPTIAEVVMWLYEKHGIWISVDTDINGKFRYIIRKYNSIDRAWEVKNPISISEYFKKPTEAYEAAIEYCLTKLI